MKSVCCKNRTAETAQHTNRDSISARKREAKIFRRAAVVILVMIMVVSMTGCSVARTILELTLSQEDSGSSHTEERPWISEQPTNPEVSEESEPMEEYRPMEETQPVEETQPEDNSVSYQGNVVDCISCGGSGNCVACNGEMHCPYCGGTGVEACYSCWGTNLCSSCMGAGKTTRGEKCSGCNGKGTCTFDVCTNGYEACWSCNGQKPCYLCKGDGKCLTCGGAGSYDLNGPQQTLTAYRKVEHDDCWYGKTVCDGSYCNEGQCAYEDCGGTGKLKCLSCEGSNECQVCTDNPRYDERSCRNCDDTGECAQCDGGYDPCYMCEGSGKCSSCHGVYEKDDRMCLDGYEYEDYLYTIGNPNQAPAVVPNPEHSVPDRPDSTDIVDCTACGGDGIRCNTCYGSGYCSNVSCMGGFVTCSRCSGARSCQTCWMWTDPGKKCPSCGYTGECQGCNGNGKNLCPSCDGYGNCPSCGGDYWCKTCDGYGFIYQ